VIERPPVGSRTPESEPRIGVDLGGTKIEGVVLDRVGGERARARVATPRGDYPGTIACVAGVVRDFDRHLGFEAPVGVGSPGAISRAHGRMKNANSTVLNDRPLREDLEAAIGREIRLANDANCFALSEATDGAAAGGGVVFGVILGTGVGGGIVVDGRLLGGPNAIAGEWGHTPLPWPRDDERPGPACYCGRAGCIETWLSGPAFARDFERARGRRLGPEAIVASAGAGDGDAAAALERYVDRLARGLAVVCDVLDPDVVVLGGGMSNVADVHVALLAALAGHVFTDAFATPVRLAHFGDASGVRGAARLWPARGDSH